MNFGDSVQQAFDKFFAFLPNLLGFLVLLLVGYIVAKIVAGIVGKVLDKIGLDRHLHSSDANKYVDRVLPGASPTKGIARVVFWLVFVFFLFAAIGALKIPAVTTFMNQVLAYLPNVIAAILIFVVAALIAGAVAAAVTNFMGDTPTGKIVASVVPAIVMVIAMFMILNQLKIAPQIVTIAFAAVMGALALGLALAFGLGGRDVARRILEDAYANGRRATEQAKQDARLGADRARSSVQIADEPETRPTTQQSTDYAPEPSYPVDQAHTETTADPRYSGGTTGTGSTSTGSTGTGSTGTGYPER
jgi:small-conductance mechanosensitive channel